MAIDWAKLGAAERAKEAELKRKPPQPNSRVGAATHRGGVNTGKTVDDFRKAKEARDKAAATKAAKATKTTQSKSSSPKPKAKPKPSKPKKTTPTAPPPKKPDAGSLVNTRRGVPTVAINSMNYIADQTQGIQAAFQALAGIELFQYTNERSVDGIFDDVSIISVLSARRKDYSPNDIIDIYPKFIKNIYREVRGGKQVLVFELLGTDNGGVILLDFYKEQSAVLEKYGSGDY